jgi:hypothetical protein
MKIVFLLLLSIVAACVAIERTLITDERVLEWIRCCDNNSESEPCPDKAISLAIKVYDLADQFVAYEGVKNNTFAYQRIDTALREEGPLRYRILLKHCFKSDKVTLTIDDIYHEDFEEVERIIDKTQEAVRKSPAAWDVQNKVVIDEHKRIREESRQRAAEFIALIAQVENISPELD